MLRKTVLALAAAFMAASVWACMGSWSFEPSANFFPLKPNETWSYRIQSKSQRATYVMTDRVIGSQYVPALKLTGEVVEEYYNFDRAGLRPVIYYRQRGYLTRLSGLQFKNHKIEAPAWGKSLNSDFLPNRLSPDMSWNNALFPYGKLPGGFEMVQTHKTFSERHEVDVPAGHFHNCIRVETQAVYKGGAYSGQKQPLKLAYRDWYAPNVGLVRTLAYEGGFNGPEMERVELIRFSDGSKLAAAAKTSKTESVASESIHAKAR
ncbi:MAG: TapB family protein [Candidatus Binataceae bacterium]